MKKTLAELRQRRAAALKVWRTAVDTAERETRDLSADEQKTVDDRQAEVAQLDKQIEQRQALDEAERVQAPAIIEQRGDGDFAERARRDFRITRAIAATFDQTVDAGLERELGQETARRTGRAFNGIAVPDEALLPIEKRTITTGGAGSLVPTQHRPDLFIDRLRPSLILPALGATILDGLVGNQSIPKAIGSSTAAWIEEEEPLDFSDPAFDDVTLTPKTVGAMTSFSRQMLLQAVPSVEQLVRNDLAAVIARAVDLSALFGDGLNGQPQGITLAQGVHNVSMATGASWQAVLEMIAVVEGADALGGNLGWATSPGAKRRLRSTPKIDGAGATGFIMESPAELAGYRVATSSALPGDTMDSPAGPAVLIFGDWSSVLLGSWSGIDILANPFEGEAYKRGRVLVRALRSIDVACRTGESFSLCDDLPAGLVT